MQPRFGNTYEIALYKRIENSLEYEEKPIVFKCKIASNKDMRSYQILNGLFNENSTLSLMTQDSVNIEPNDKVIFLGEVKIVTSVGVFLNKNRMLSQSVFDDEHILANSPKGITLQWHIQ